MADGPLGHSERVIRVVAPAGPVNEADLDRGVEVLRGRGFTVELAPHVRDREGYLAGPDDVRGADLRAAMDDPRVDVVWFARGGFGTTRVLHALQASNLSGRFKLLAGFSDATALFAWAQGIPGVRCLYAPSVQELGREGVCELGPLWAALAGEEVAMPAEGPAETVGPFPVAGGCLSICTVLVGTPWEPDVADRWLLLEDVAEPMYRLDRMLTHLAQAGWFRRVAGVLLGGFTGMAAGETAQLVAARVRELTGPGKPVLADLPVGHIKGKWPLPLEAPALWDGRRLVVHSRMS